MSGSNEISIVVSCSISTAKPQLNAQEMDRRSKYLENTARSGLSGKLHGVKLKPRKKERPGSDLRPYHPNPYR